MRPHETGAAYEVFEDGNIILPQKDPSDCFKLATVVEVSENPFGDDDADAPFADSVAITAAAPRAPPAKAFV